MTACIRRRMSTWPTCKCPDCARLRRINRGLSELHPTTWRVPSDVAWDAMTRLVDAGWTCSAIATATGLQPHYVSGLMADYRAGRRRKIGPGAAKALVNASTPTVGHIPAVGSTRRLRALTRAGWTGDRVATVAGLSPSTLSPILAGTRRRLSADTAAAIAGAYDRLSGGLGRNLRAAQRAVRAGWPGPWDWDGLDMDDPAVVPDGFKKTA